MLTASPCLPPVASLSIPPAFNLILGHAPNKETNATKDARGKTTMAN